MVAQLAVAYAAVDSASLPRRAVSRARSGLCLLMAALLIASAGIVSAEELRDPTRPHTHSIERTVEGAPNFAVNAIFVSSDRRLAIVNGERVRIGDSVGGATVVDIQKEQVTLSVSGKQFIARLKTRRR